MRHIVCGFYLALFTLILPYPGWCGEDDPYEPATVITKGPHKGEIVNAKERRSIQILEMSGNNALVANVSHARTFWIGLIPLEQVTEVIFERQYFGKPVKLAHTMLLFRFKPGAFVTLTPQLKSQSNMPPQKLGELVFSIEVVPQTGRDRYSVIKGAMNQFAVAYRFMSLSEKYAKAVEKDHNRVRQARLNMSPEQVRAVLTAAILRSDARGTRYMYNTLCRNCSDELFRIFDEVIEYKGLQKTLRLFTKLSELYPVWVKPALSARGLLGKDLPDLNSCDIIKVL